MYIFFHVGSDQVISNLREMLITAFLLTGEHVYILRTCETLWSARKIASVALTAKRKTRTENVFHMLLKERNSINI